MEWVALRFRLIGFLIVFAFCVAPAYAVAQQTGGGVIEGFVTTQGGTIRLGGAQVVLHDAANQEISTVLSEGDGRFRFTALQEGKYAITASLEGFAFGRVTAVVVLNTTTEQSIDLPLATLTQTVEVMAPTAVVSAADTLGSAESIGSHETDEFASGTGLGGALRLLASVIEVPGGVSIKGGRPTQAGVQIGASTLTDPVLGLVHFTLPDDAIDSVAVMANPYAVEYGRFSSGLVVIQTRRGSDLWHIRLNNLSPTFRSKRHEDLYNINGIAGFAPNFELGGPLVKNRVFLEQTAQYRYSNDDVPSRPEDERKTTHWISSFTRVDANLTPKHALVGTAGFFPSVSNMASLSTFTPPDATVDIHERVMLGTITERALWSDSLVSESTVQVRSYQASVQPQGTAPMQLRPETTLGNFFNTQYRSPTTFQLIQNASGSAKLPSGLHLFKVGLDLLINNYDGTSQSRPLLIEATDGTLVRRLDASGPSVQMIPTFDVALYAQDRVQPNSRTYFEFGARLDRDGVVGRWNVTPRVGAAFLTNAQGTSVLRGGYGLFFERTPSAAGAFKFGQFETFTDTRFADDGVTPLGPPVTYLDVTSPNLRTARAATWDVTYEYRWRPSVSFHVSFLDRQGSHELMLDAERVGNIGAFRLDSDGQSTYRDLEVGAHLSHSTRFDLTATYSRAMAVGDLNSFANYFDTMLWPVVPPRGYGPLPTDVPNRLLARGRILPAPNWLIVAVADWRNGLPYSLVDAALDFVGPRNEQRMPDYLRFDLGLEHRFHIGKLQPWIGIRAYNAFNAFLPADVQANISSPAFGSFYNSQFRQYRLQVRFER
jgi:hypothetical protein